ncbi:hypothetical protein EVAR_45799_1 [Eumeta japonica]|uniref:Uncharacterized protein n=1 Tax=Eumeta variegata TaxID=151549 RepID=A0A4C1X3W3_EUMVA|nr:hypothetical protein EVAR_45799_1 [Eumeta japonica]
MNRSNSHNEAAHPYLTPLRMSNQSVYAPFILTQELETLYSRLRLMMELEGGHRNSVIKRRNPIEFGLV